MEISIRQDQSAGMKTKNEIIKPLTYAEFQQMVYPENLPNPLPDIDAYFARLLEHFNRFSIGKFCWFVADRLKGTTHAAGGKSTEIIGLHPDVLVGNGPEIVFGRTHPDDLPRALAYSDYWTRFLSDIAPEKRKNFLPCIFLRVLNGAGVYAWVMVQYLDSYLDEMGNAMYIFTAITDVSHIRHTGEALMTIRDIANNTTTCIRCQDHGDLHEDANQLRPITPREQEILRHLASGLSSKQIASQLNVSIHTVNNHRQSLLRKAGAKSTAELVSYGVLMGHLAW